MDTHLPISRSGVLSPGLWVDDSLYSSPLMLHIKAPFRGEACVLTPHEWSEMEEQPKPVTKGIGEPEVLHGSHMILEYNAGILHTFYTCAHPCTHTLMHTHTEAQT